MLPLEASAVPTQTLAGLKRACQGLEPFGDKDVGEFAEFLRRAAGYEREGKWPTDKPPIAGSIVDEPSARDYAERLQMFLEREVSAASPVSDKVREELKRLEGRLKLKGIKEIARELRVEDHFTKAQQGLEKIVLQLTGQNLGGKKKAASSRSRSAKIDPATIPQLAVELKNLAGSPGLEQRLSELKEPLSTADLKALAESLGASSKARNKDPLIQSIRSALQSPLNESTTAGATTSAHSGASRPPQQQTTSPTEPGARGTSSADSKVLRLTEIVAALKAKADGPDAPYDEIEAELRSLEGQLSREEAIAIAERIGIVRHLNSRNEAVEEIRRKVFEMKRARESIAY